MSTSRLLFLFLLSMFSEWTLFYRQSPLRFLSGLVVTPFSLLAILVGSLASKDCREHIFWSAFNVMIEEAQGYQHQWVIKQWVKTAQQLKEST